MYPLPLDTEVVLAGLLLLRGTGDPDGDDQQDDADDAELAELITAQKSKNRHAGEWQKAEAKSDNVASVYHSTMPSISRVQLFGGSNVQ